MKAECKRQFFTQQAHTANNNNVIFWFKYLIFKSCFPVHSKFYVIGIKYVS